MSRYELKIEDKHIQLWNKGNAHIASLARAAFEPETRAEWSEAHKDELRQAHRAADGKGGSGSANHGHKTKHRSNTARKG